MAAPRIAAVEIVVEMDDGARSILRLTRPQILTFDRGDEREGDHVRRVKFDVEGRCASIGPHYRPALARGFSRGGRMDGAVVVGRTVHYCQEGGRQGQGKGECRPAVVVRVWDANAGTSNLVVTQDGANDRGATSPEGPLHSWKTSIVKGGPGEPGKWHWPQECVNASGGPPVAAPAS